MAPLLLSVDSEVLTEHGPVLSSELSKERWVLSLEAPQSLLAEDASLLLPDASELLPDFSIEPSEGCSVVTSEEFAVRSRRQVWSLSRDNSTSQAFCDDSEAEASQSAPAPNQAATATAAICRPCLMLDPSVWESVISN